MDMNIRRQANPRVSNRIDLQEVKNLYKQEETYKISLNDQLETFYEKCKINDLIGHEVAYYFHTELLSPDEFAVCHEQVQRKETQKHFNEIELLEKKFSLFASPYRKKLRSAEIDEAKQRYESKVEESRQSEFRIYGGVRATLLFHPNRGLPVARQLNRLSDILSPMLYTQYWRKWDPVDVPQTTSEVEVIGFERHEKITNELCNDIT